MAADADSTRTALSSETDIESPASPAAYVSDPAPTDPVRPPGAAAAGAEVAPVGGRIDRFVVLRQIGVGGAGRVVAAHDPELDRTVAIKVMRPERVVMTDATRARFVREARAIAQLAHPNVVAVHDIGITDGQPFIAMEYVDGVPLSEWMRTPHPLADVVRVFEQAGRGLAAAHAKGIVHRDFKPGNVLVGKDGRVRVADFGLARALDEPVAAEAPPVDADPAVATAVDPPAAATLTVTGTIMGTPAYMAPEQRLGADVDARADQYAFCVALAEAATGRRPRVGTPFDGGRLPTWLAAALQRGLALRPEDRFASMTELLAVLGQDRGRTRRRLVTAAVVAALGGVGALAIVLAAAPPERCGLDDDPFVGVWDGPRRAALRAAFARAGTAHVDTSARVEQALDAYAARWTAMRRDNCEATHVRREQSGASLDLRTRCLTRRRAELGALTEALARIHTGDELAAAVPAVFQLVDVAVCADAATLAAGGAPPRDGPQRAQVEALTARLDRAKALGDLGQIPAAQAEVTAVVAAARTVAYPPLVAEALYARGGLEVEAGAAAEALATFQETAAVAAGIGDDVRLAEAWLGAINVAGGSAAMTALAPVARAAVTRAGAPPRLRAALARALGRMHHVRLELDQALAEHRTALAILEGESPATPAVAELHEQLGDVLRLQGKYVEAEAANLRAIAIYQTVYGAAHPQIADALYAQGDAEKKRGELGAARDHVARALAIYTAAFGPEHAKVGIAHRGLGNVALAEGKLDEARAAYDRALAILVARRGPDDPDVGTVWSNRGLVWLAQDEPARARADFERALAISERTLGPDHPNLAFPLNNLGVAAGKLGDHAAAAGYCRRALAIETAKLGPTHPYIADDLTCVGAAELMLGDTAAATAHLAQALAIRDGAAGDPLARAGTQFVYARALWAGGARAQATALVAEARRAYVAAGAGGRQKLAEIAAWERTRRR